MAEKKNPVVIMETSKGTIKIELFEDKAPITVKNFLTYVDEKFYDGTIFHRIAVHPQIGRWVIQGGGYTTDGSEKDTHDPIKNEATNRVSNVRGTIAMARTSVVDSATSQFFINTMDNDFLDHTDKTTQGFGYCVFGKVIDGMDVVDEIAKVQLIRGSEQPAENVVIKSVKRQD